MAKVIAKLNPFNRSSSKNKGPTVTPAGQESSTESSANSGGSDLVKRRVSVSKSGRYKENHKRRSALHHDDAQDKENICTDHIINEKEKKNIENRSKQEASNNARKQNENNMNNNNNNNISRAANLNSLGRHSTLSNSSSSFTLSNYDTIGSLDGHAVAEEIECLAKTLTMENSRIVSDL